MNFVNRLLVMVGLVIAIAAAPISIVLVLFFTPGLANTLNNIGRTLAGGPSAFLIQVICVITALTVFIVSILLLFLELNRPSVRRLHVSQVTEGQVEVTEEAIIQRLEHSIALLADIVAVKPRVAATKKGKAVDAFIELETNPEVNVPQKTQEVITTAKQVMEQQMGLQVGKVVVQLNYSRKETKAQGA